MTQSTERRAAGRRAHTLVARLAAQKGDNQLSAVLRTVDIAPRGVFLASTFFVPPGTEAELTIDLPEGGSTVAKGRVVRVAKDGEAPGFAIAFDQITEPSKWSALAG